MEKIGKRSENTVVDFAVEPVRAGDLKVARGPGVTRRSLVAAFASATMALALLAGCGGAPAGDAGSDPAPKAQADTSASTTGMLIVGFDQAYPPYGYVGDDGKYTGFDLDLAQAVAKRLDWELQLEPIDWDAKDALGSTSTSPRRSRSDSTGSSNSSPSTGMPRTPCSSRAPSTAFGTASPWRAARTTTPSPIRTC